MLSDSFALFQRVDTAADVGFVLQNRPFPEYSSLIASSEGWQEEEPLLQGGAAEGARSARSRGLGLARQQRQRGPLAIHGVVGRMCTSECQCAETRGICRPRWCNTLLSGLPG